MKTRRYQEKGIRDWDGTGENDGTGRVPFPSPEKMMERVGYFTRYLKSDRADRTGKLGAMSVRGWTVSAALTNRRNGTG